VGDGAVLIDPRFQGPTGSGQGGYTAGILAGHLGGRVMVDIHRPIPLGVELRVEVEGDRARALHGDEVVLRAARVSQVFAASPPVEVDAARAAWGRPQSHASPDCFACGLGAESFRVWAGPVADGILASPWSPPSWSAGASGRVADPFVWAAIDCPAGWAIARQTSRRTLTIQFGAEILAPIYPVGEYVVTAVAQRWRGRAFRAATSLYEPGGRLMARASSVWLEV
jgi:hypothetical protein